MVPSSHFSVSVPVPVPVLGSRLSVSAVLTRVFRPYDPEEFSDLLIRGLNTQLQDLQNSANSDAGTDDAGAAAASTGPPETSEEQEQWRAEIRELGESAKKDFAQVIDAVCAHSSTVVPTLPPPQRRIAMVIVTAVIGTIKSWFSALNPAVLLLKRTYRQSKAFLAKLSARTWAAILAIFEYLLNPTREPELEAPYLYFTSFSSPPPLFILVGDHATNAPAFLRNSRMV